MEFIYQQPAMLSEGDSKAVLVNDRIDSVLSEQVQSPETEVSMSAQRKRRALRVARRPQRLAFGPASEHATEILRAIQLVEEKNGSIDRAVHEGKIDASQKSNSSEKHGSDGIQLSEGSSTEVDSCLIIANSDAGAGDQSSSRKPEGSLRTTYAEDKRENTAHGDKPFAEIVSRDDKYRIGATPPETHPELAEKLFEDNKGTDNTNSTIDKLASKVSSPSFTDRVESRTSFYKSSR